MCRRGADGGLSALSYRSANELSTSNLRLRRCLNLKATEARLDRGQPRSVAANITWMRLGDALLVTLLFTADHR